MNSSKVNAPYCRAETVYFFNKLKLSGTATLTGAPRTPAGPDGPAGPDSPYKNHIYMTSKTHEITC